MVLIAPYLPPNPLQPRAGGSEAAVGLESEFLAVIPSSSVMKVFRAAFFGVLVSCTLLNARDLTDDEILRLSNYVTGALLEPYEVEVLKLELEQEKVVGRALLLHERKNKLESSQAKTLEEYRAFRDTLYGQVRWFNDWDLTFLSLGVAPSRLAKYKQESKQVAKEYESLVSALQDSMIAVAESNGDASKIDEMKEIKERMKLLVDVESTIASRKLDSNEIQWLEESFMDVYITLLEAGAAEQKLKEENVIGRALLLMEEKKKSDIELAEAREKLDAFLRKRSRIDWLGEWSEAYRNCVHVTRLQFIFENIGDAEKAGRASELAKALQNGLRDALQKEGESSTIDSLRKLQEEVSSLRETN